jgi:protoporphyrinogen IX oxidase
MQGWIAFHIISVVCWFAGLFYLPRLFVYHAMSSEKAVQDQLLIMEQKLYKNIMRLSMVLTLLSGARLFMFYWNAGGIQTWLWIKVGIVFLLLGYHHMCGYYLKQFEKGANSKTHVFFRLFNEVPVFFLVSIVCLVILKPLL